MSTLNIATFDGVKEGNEDSLDFHKFFRILWRHKEYSASTSEWYRTMSKLELTPDHSSTPFEGLNPMQIPIANYYCPFHFYVKYTKVK